MLREDQDYSSTPEETNESDQAISVNDSILCRDCEREISTNSHVISVGPDGANQAFANPAGYLREVLTVSEAWNLSYETDASTDFTWFAGYAWRICYCDVCNSHLGWRYEAADEIVSLRAFYGLLSKAIKRT